MHSADGGSKFSRVSYYTSRHNLFKVGVLFVLPSAEIGILHIICFTRVRFWRIICLIFFKFPFFSNFAKLSDITIIPFERYFHDDK